MIRYFLSTWNSFSGHCSVEIQKSGLLKDFINQAACVSIEAMMHNWEGERREDLLLTFG